MVNLVGMANMLDQNGLMQQVGVKMLDNALEVQKEQNDSMIKMMEQSVQPDLGRNIDISV